MAVGRKTGGRKKGALNKKTQEFNDKLASYNCDPMEKLVKIAQEAENEGDMHLASSIYKEMCQYAYPKRKAVELTGEVSVLTHEQWIDSLIDEQETD